MRSPQCRLTAQLARAFHSGTGTARAFYTVAIAMGPIRSVVPTGIAQAGAVPTRYSAESTVSCQLGWAAVSKRKRACLAVQFRLVDVRLDPSMADAYGQLGDTYRSMDDYDESVRHYE